MEQLGGKTALSQIRTQHSAFEFSTQLNCRNRFTVHGTVERTVVTNICPANKSHARQQEFYVLLQVLVLK